MGVLSDYRLVVNPSTGAVQLWSIPPTERSETKRKHSAITASEFVKLPEQVFAVSVKLQDEGFIGRRLRQIVDA